MVEQVGVPSAKVKTCATVGKKSQRYRSMMVFFSENLMVQHLRAKGGVNIVLLRLVPQVGQRAAVVQANLACAEYLR